MRRHPASSIPALGASLRRRSLSCCPPRRIPGRPASCPAALMVVDYPTIDRAIHIPVTAWVQDARGPSFEGLAHSGRGIRTRDLRVLRCPGGSFLDALRCSCATRDQRRSAEFRSVRAALCKNTNPRTFRRLLQLEDRPALHPSGAREGIHGTTKDAQGRGASDQGGSSPTPPPLSQAAEARRDQVPHQPRAQADCLREPWRRSVLNQLQGR